MWENSKNQAQESISSLLLRIYCCWYANFGHVNLQREEEEEVGPISFVDLICSSERRRELWCEEWCEERKEGSWGPLFSSDTRTFVYSNWVPLENLFWYWKLAPIGYYLEMGKKGRFLGSSLFFWHKNFCLQQLGPTRKPFLVLKIGTHRVLLRDGCQIPGCEHGETCESYAEAPIFSFFLLPPLLLAFTRAVSIPREVAEEEAASSSPPKL